MSVVLVRHTRPAIEEGICYGRTDLSLAASFAKEASAVIAKLSPAEIVVSSPLGRCHELATAIGAAFGLDVDVDDRLQEMDFGRWEQQAWNDIPRAELDAWANDFLHARPHGGESVAMLQKRALAAADSYRASGKSHIVVTHAGVIRTILARGDTAADFEVAVEFGGSKTLPGE